MSDKVSLGGALKAAFGFWWDGVRAASGILALTTIGGAWFQFVSLQDLASKTDSSVAMVALLAYLLMLTLAQGALYRKALSAIRPGDPDYQVGPLGFQVGRIELSILTATLLTLLLYLFLITLLLLGLGSVLIAVGVSSQKTYATADQMMAALGPLWPPGRAWLMVVGSILGGVALTTWFAIRLSLYLAATAAEQRVRVLSSWPLTGGLFWKLVAGHLVLAAPVLLLVVAQARLLGPAANLLHLQAFGADIRAVSIAISAGMSVFYHLPVMAAFNSYIYDRVGPTTSTDLKTP